MQPSTSTAARAHACACAMPSLPPRTITRRGIEHMRRRGAAARTHAAWSLGASGVPAPSVCPQTAYKSASYPELSALLSREAAAVQTSTAEASVTAAAANAPMATAQSLHVLPLATMSRILLVVQPARWANLAQRRPTVSGPISLLLFLAGMVLAAWAAVRAALVRRVRSCGTCRGYGIVRCKLCAGQGTVDWKAKFNYSDFCPLCMSKRYIECQDCGGHYHRPLFEHARRNDGTYAPST